VGLEITNNELTCPGAMLTFSNQSFVFIVFCFSNHCSKGTFINKQALRGDAYLQFYFINHPPD